MLSGLGGARYRAVAWLAFRRFSAAATKSRNSGWALVGFDLNSGWNCTARNQG